MKTSLRDSFEKYNEKATVYQSPTARFTSPPTTVYRSKSIIYQNSTDTIGQTTSTSASGAFVIGTISIKSIKYYFNLIILII